MYNILSSIILGSPSTRVFLLFLIFIWPSLSPPPPPPPPLSSPSLTDIMGLTFGQSVHSTAVHYGYRAIRIVINC